MTDFDTLPEATRRAINFMSDRFFLVRADGTLTNRNDTGLLSEFAFSRETTARRYAARNGARIYDKELRRFI